MTRIVYVNGDYLPEGEAKVSIFDRGFLMADGVYEVTTVLDGKLIDFDGHFTRLERSLNELDIANPMDRDQWLEVHRQLVAQNAVDQGMVYLQVTRGAPGDRDFIFPDPDTTAPTVVLFTQSNPALVDSPKARRGHEGRDHRRYSLGTARHQDGATALPQHGQDDGHQTRRG